MHLKRPREVSLPLLVALLLALGLVVLSSAAAPSDFHKQLLGVLLATLPVLLVWWAGRGRLWQAAPWLYGASVGLLLLTALFGREVNGSKNWLAIGPLQFQPVEIAKLGLILLLARTLRGGYTGWRFYARALAVFVPVMGLVVTHDFGDAMVLAVIFLAVLFSAGMKKRHLLLVLAALTALFPTVIYPHLKPYQQARLTSFLHPERDPRGSGYQVLQAAIAIGSGGMQGKGYGNGTQIHHGFVFSQFSDFVVASLAEEHGFVGCTVMLTLFGGLLWRLATVSEEQLEARDRLVTVGVLAWIGAQVVENVGAALSLLPLAGITLPLISYGLTSLVMVLSSLGVVYTLHGQPGEL